ncbi:MAG: N-acetylmuramoyl-L-alanine amidase [Alphaproteobacteria bacterium]|nr:MAG: N-acetylmuramoyl-L-alanine amidase [Alphaproteobacteria bacterium]
MFSPGIARLVIELAGPLEIVTARNSATGLTLTLRRIGDADFAAAVARGRRPLPVVSGGPPSAAARTNVPSPAAPTAPVFELPQDMFQTRGTPPATVAPVAAPPATTTPATPAPQPIQPPPARTTNATADIPLAIPPQPASPQRRTGGVRPRNGSRPLVVIDAGHGGKDVGAISVNGGYEKDVTLAIARATAAALRRRGKVDVRLTRDDDRFIPLGGRVKIAQLARADLFVSIHADSAPNSQARGASVYTLSSVASDAVAARLAARENKADIIGGVNLGVEAPDVGDIMIDLSRRATGNVSVAFAETLQDELSDRIKFRGEFHHFAGFLVLKAPDVPSVLLETGYVTNTDDAALLFSAAGRKRVAAGVARAIERHLLGN